MTPEEIQSIRAQFKYDPSTLSTGMASPTQDVNSRLAKFRGEEAKVTQSEAVSGISLGKDIGAATKETFVKPFQDRMQQIVDRPDQSFGSDVLQTAGALAGGVSDIALGAVKEGVKVFTPQVVQDKVSELAQKAGITVAGAIPQEALTALANHPEALGNIQAIVDLATTVPAIKPVAEALQGVTKTAIKVAGQGAKTAVKVGAPAIAKTGEAVGTVVKPIKTVLDKRAVAKQEGFVKELLTPNLTTKATAEAIKTGKVTEAGLKGERDVTKAVPNFGEISKVVSEVPGVSKKKTLLENANAIHDEIGVTADDLVLQLQNQERQIGKDRGFFSPNEFKGYMKTVRGVLSDNPTIVGDAEKTAGKIITKFENLISKNGHTPTGLLKSRKELDNWMSSQKGGKVFDPNTENAVSVALRAIRQGGNDFLASKVPDVAVKELLNKQSKLYNAIDLIAPKAAKEGSNAWKRWAKAHPKTMAAAKLGGAAAVGGGTINVLSQ